MTNETTVGVDTTVRYSAEYAYKEMDDDWMPLDRINCSDTLDEAKLQLHSDLVRWKMRWPKDFNQFKFRIIRRELTIVALINGDEVEVDGGVKP